MLHHLSLQVSDINKSAKLYDAIFSCLGYIRAWTSETAIGYGLEKNKDKFAIKQRNSIFNSPGTGFHVAFTAHSKEEVEQFHKVALKLGAIDNGKPGLRPEYGSNYFAAFIIDYDGYQLEALYK